MKLVNFFLHFIRRKGLALKKEIFQEFNDLVLKLLASITMSSERVFLDQNVLKAELKNGLTKQFSNLQCCCFALLNRAFKLLSYLQLSKSTRRGSSLNSDQCKGCQKEKPRPFVLKTPKFF